MASFNPASLYRLTSAPQQRRPFFGGSELASLAGGLTARPSAPGFWGGFTAGLGGAVGGAAQYAANTHQGERDKLKQMMEERRFALDQSQLEEAIRHNKAMEAKQGTQASVDDWTVPTTTPEGETVRAPFPGLENIPPAGREIAFREMMQKKYDTTGDGTKPTTYGERFNEQKIAAYMRLHKGATRDQAIAALSFGKPRLSRTETQAQDPLTHAPLYYNSKGTITDQPYDRKTLQPNKPYIVQSQRIYEDEEGGPLTEFLRKDEK